MSINEDENLPPTLDAFKSAIHALIEPTIQYTDGQVRTIYSLYNQLDESVGGTSDHPGGGGGNKSKPPVWIEALELAREIDMSVMIWQPGPLGPANVHETVWRLRVLAARSYRPQDCRQLTQMTEALNQWAQDIDQLLNPPDLTPLWDDHCPVCGASQVWRMNDEGKFVPEPALVVEYGVGVSCRNRRQCRDETTGQPAHWPWAQKLFIGKLLQDQRDAKKHATNQEVA